MKKTLLFMALCTVIIVPAKASWSYRYWYCPVSWSEAKVYFQIGLAEGKDGYCALYVAGEGSLPDSDENNTTSLDFQYSLGHLPSSRLPLRSGGTLSEIVFDF